MKKDFQTLPMPSLAEFSFSNSNNKELSLLTDESLWHACGVRIVFTDRCGGVSEGEFSSLNLHHKDGDTIENEYQNRNLLMSCFDDYIERQKLVCPNQVHGSNILIVEDAQQTNALAQDGADGILCNKCSVPVLLCFADCVPVIVVAPDSSFAILHAGWRGAYSDITAKGLKMLASEASCCVADCNIYIGPHIGTCCFEVSDELAQQFAEKYGLDVVPTKRHVDLSSVIIKQLICIGADKNRIADAKVCTSCNIDKYYSYRAENGKCGRHGAFAFIR